MAERIYLHIGAPKSGTTFLQSVLWANKDGLRQQGLLLPGADQFDAFYATMNVRAVSRESGLPPRAHDAWARLSAEVQAWPHDALISHEFFAAASADQAKRAIADLVPAQTHIIFTARDYVATLPAMWQEAVKVGSRSTFTAFVQSMLSGRRRGPLGWDAADLPAVLDRWTSSLPPQHVHVVTVPPAGSDPDVLWQRFCSVIDVAPERFTMPQTRRNASLGAVEAELVRRLNPKLRRPLGKAGAPHYRWVRRYLAEDLLVSRQGRRFGVPAADAEALRQRSAGALDYISERGLDVVGDLEDLVCAPVNIHGPDPDSVSETELLDAALDTIADLLDRQRRADRAAARRRETATEPRRQKQQPRQGRA